MVQKNMGYCGTEDVGEKTDLWQILVQNGFTFTDLCLKFY